MRRGRAYKASQDSEQGIREQVIRGVREQGIRGNSSEASESRASEAINQRYQRAGHQRTGHQRQIIRVGHLWSSPSSPGPWAEESASSGQEAKESWFLVGKCLYMASGSSMLPCHWPVGFQGFSLLAIGRQAEASAVIGWELRCGALLAPRRLAEVDGDRKCSLSRPVSPLWF